jgi:hypothetical protein
VLTFDAVSPTHASALLLVAAFLLHCGAGAWSLNDTTGPDASVDAPTGADAGPSGDAAGDAGGNDALGGGGGQGDGACASAVSQGEPAVPCTNVVMADPTTLDARIAGAQPGDCITLASGMYTFGAMALAGTAAQPIVVRAAVLGGATVNVGTLTLTGSYAVIEGLTWTTQDPINVGVCDHCRITRNTFRATPSTHTDWLVLRSAMTTNTRIDHNEFGPQTVEGNQVLVFGSNATVASHVQIDHNYFHDIGPFGPGNPESQPVRLGNSGYYGSAFATVEYNLFENANGDPEVISSKSSDNTIRFNTVLNSAGTISLRLGDRGTVNGNFVIGNGMPNSGGIRMSGNDHEVYDNYVYDVQEGIAFEGDTPDGGIVDGSVLHAQVHNAQVVFNSVISSSRLGLDLQHESLPPADSVVANNLFTQSSGTLIHEPTTPVGLTVQGNIASLTSGATLGVSAPSSAFSPTDPMLVTAAQPWRLGPGSSARGAANNAGLTLPFLVDDMDGQPRTMPMDVGADQYSTACVTQRPLTTADVGPNAP